MLIAVAKLAVTLAGCALANNCRGLRVYRRNRTQTCDPPTRQPSRRHLHPRADIACFAGINYPLDSGLDTPAMDAENQVCTLLSHSRRRSLTPALQTFARPSGLKPPSRVPTLLREDPTSPTSIPRPIGLSELTETMQNSRGAMGPPFNGSTKHKPSGRKLIPASSRACEFNSDSSRTGIKATEDPR
jgi:hypothetical protein